MLSLIIPIVVFLSLLLILQVLLRLNSTKVLERQILDSFRTLSQEELLDLLAKYGTNANSFLSLYPGFHYFTSQTTEGVIAFTVTPQGWVAAAEPLCAEENQFPLLQEFIATASKVNKVVVMLPIPEAFAQKAIQAHFHVVMIGCEPTFDFAEYPPSGKKWNDMIVVARQLGDKGAVVTEFFPQNISEDQLKELNEVTQAWLGSRKMEPLAFLNQVDPWLFSEHKKFFKIEINGKIPAFMAAIPIIGRGGWYLIDVLRRPEAPVGTTELLMLQAMRFLKDQGAKDASLGVAPLSHMEDTPNISAAQFAINRKLYGIFKWMYENGQLFYGFNSLYQFKAKFKPTSTPAAFALIATSACRIRIVGVFKVILSISNAMMPKGLAKVTFLNFLRILSNISVTDWIRGQVSSQVIVRSAPPNLRRLIQRCKFTLVLSIIHLLAIAYWSATAQAFSSTGAVINIIALILFTGVTEYFAGMNITGFTFISMGAIGYTLYSFLQGTFVSDPNSFLLAISLGIVATGGSLHLFLKNKKVLSAVVVAIVALYGGFGSAALFVSCLLSFAGGVVITWKGLNWKS